MTKPKQKVSRSFKLCVVKQLSIYWEIGQGLYQLGCRNIIVAGVPPIGCIPIQETLAFQDPKDRKCLQNQNSDSQNYNHNLSKLLHDLQELLPGSKIHYIDIYNLVIDMINNPQKYDR